MIPQLFLSVLACMVVTTAAFANDNVTSEVNTDANSEVNADVANSASPTDELLNLSNDESLLDQAESADMEAFRPHYFQCFAYNPYYGRQYYVGGMFPNRQRARLTALYRCERHERVRCVISHCQNLRM